MRHRHLRETNPFLLQVQQLEDHLFAGEFPLDSTKRIQSERQYWHFRPSHHVKSGLITLEDVTLLKEPGKRLLSIGATPAMLERTLVALGIPADHILVVDKDPAIAKCAGFIPSMVFDMNDHWPEMGTFDRIIFPESLCIAVGDSIKESESVRSETSGAHPTDESASQLLAQIMRQALERLRPGGIIRANGPMSHPKVIRMMSENLKKEGWEIALENWRFFLSMQLQSM
ncbi:MAG: hypothetical protein WCG83_07205 [Candidatus Peregrinibacteria bacterium]